MCTDQTAFGVMEEVSISVILSITRGFGQKGVMPLSAWLTKAKDSPMSEKEGRLPPGRRTVPLLGQTLTFHDEAHDEIRMLVRSTGSETVRLSVIGRNVALVTSYEDAKSLLTQEWKEGEGSPLLSLSRKQAYKQLMSAFYSPPNLLLEDEDGPDTREHRQTWDKAIGYGLRDVKLNARIQEIINRWMSQNAPSGIFGSSDSTETDSTGAVDLYEVCKELGHALAVGTFLGIDDTDQAYPNVKVWSEEMLRGQFTLPLGVNVGFFQNSFSKGQASKVRFDAMVSERLKKNADTSSGPSCPFASNADIKLSEASLISHHAMFSSNLVVKALASLALALLLQVYRRESQDGVSLAEQIHATENRQKQESLLESVITETQRLSPPIVGVMRRVKDRSISLGSREQGSTRSNPVQVPQGWDVWPYFPLANRDEKVFGHDARHFVAERYSPKNDTPPPPPLTFGAGVKGCAGQDVVTMWLKTLVKNVVEVWDISFDEHSLEEGVKDWLGWSTVEGEVSWKSLKQLPTQRPRTPVKVHIASRKDA